jgi:hypothetical protein
MGSSILASLSEAGGNDPSGLVSKPLPSHSLDPADRVERNPHRYLLQAKGPIAVFQARGNLLSLNELAKLSGRLADDGSADPGILSHAGIGPPDTHFASFPPNMLPQRH